MLYSVRYLSNYKDVTKWISHHNLQQKHIPQRHVMPSPSRYLESKEGNHVYQDGGSEHSLHIANTWGQTVLCPVEDKAFRKVFRYKVYNISLTSIFKHRNPLTITENYFQYCYWTGMSEELPSKTNLKFLVAANIKVYMSV